VFLKKAIDKARDDTDEVRDPSVRRVLAMLIGIVRRLSEPEIEQPIAPEPPDEGGTTPPTNTTPV
jgi:hypothetical protein